MVQEGGEMFRLKQSVVLRLCESPDELSWLLAHLDTRSPPAL